MTDEARTPSPDPTDPADLSGVEPTGQAFIRTVDGLGREELGAPSLLPGWTRAHVVAHVALSGEALAGVLDAVSRHEPVAMYESDARRDADIDELALADPAVLRERLLGSRTRFADAVGLMAPEHWTGTFDRLPGGPAWPVVTVVSMRRRELEIHHADLRTSYTRHDWPADFCLELMAALTVDQAASGPFRARATDLGRDWHVGGEGGPTVMGTAADLGWWLSGRGAGEGLSCDAEALPTLGLWRRASATAGPTPAQ